MKSEIPAFLIVSLSLSLIFIGWVAGVDTAAYLNMQELPGHARETSAVITLAAKGIPISVDSQMNYWMWDEKLKVSYRVDPTMLGRINVNLR